MHHHVPFICFLTCILVSLALAVYLDNFLLFSIWVFFFFDLILDMSLSLFLSFLGNNVFSKINGFMAVGKLDCGLPVLRCKLEG